MLLKKAVAEGLFAVYAVSDVDEAICVTMGHTAGMLSSRGTYPKNTVHHVAISRLFAISNVVNGGHEE